MDRDIQALGKLTEDPEVVQNEQFQLGVLDSRAEKIMQRQQQLESDNVGFYNPSKLAVLFNLLAFLYSNRSRTS